MATTSELTTSNGTHHATLRAGTGGGGTPTLVERDRLWLTGQDRVDSFVARFTRAPFVESHYLEGVGHNIDHHHAGPAFHQSQLDFAQRCARQAAAEAAGSENLHVAV